AAHRSDDEGRAGGVWRREGAAMSDTAGSPAGAAIEVRPTGAALGAEIRGVDLRALDAAAFAAIHRAWLDHQVLLFRDLALTDDDLVAFSRRFGDLDEAPVQESGQR